jgi:hypothetical protein
MRVHSVTAMMVELNQHVVVAVLPGTSGPSTIELCDREKLKVKCSVYWFASTNVMGRSAKLGAKGFCVEEMV